MRNRLAALTIVACALGAFLVILSGCQRSATSGAGAEPADQNALVLQQLRDYQDKTGQRLDALMSQIKDQQKLAESRAGDPPLVRDLAVARGAVVEAQKAVQVKNADAAAAAIRRLKRVVQAMNAELPGMIIAQHVDRAIYQINTQTAVGGKEFVGASSELLEASDAYVNGRPVALVPNVAKDLDAARSALDKGDGAEARQTLDAVLATATNTPAAVALGRAQAALRGAEDALGRQAWPVLEAEFTELDNLLAELARTVTPGETTAGAKETTATQAGEAGATTSDFGAATSNLPTQQPAAAAPAAPLPAAQPAAIPQAAPAGQVAPAHQPPPTAVGH